MIRVVGSRERATSLETPEALGKWRMGRSSRRTGKPSTQAERSKSSLMAKAPSLETSPMLRSPKKAERHLS
jgi:hypothetical protein